MADTLALMALCLALTLAVEVAGARTLFGIRDARALAVIALAQCATNPLVEAGTVCAYLLLPRPYPLAFVAVLEVCAFVAEALIYRAKGVGVRPWHMSAALNTLSICVGFILFPL